MVDHAMPSLELGRSLAVSSLLPVRSADGSLPVGLREPSVLRRPWLLPELLPKPPVLRTWARTRSARPPTPRTRLGWPLRIGPMPSVTRSPGNSGA